ncbi:hypothetical protein [Luteimonas suaedae]|uniref:hypothetical protein n=1 Tax=Luteimonas suaedae TaxID=2605430 RepID=UPI00165A01C3|nr:hypothetical protein [Luteimonas suaedae]
MVLRFALLLLLCSASLPLLAREVRQAGANGDGGCPTSTVPEEDAGTSVPRGERPGTTAPAAKERATGAAGGSTENSVRPPRWHSFLPGMFR